MSALRYWEGHIYKDDTEVGFANGTFTINRGTQYFQSIGDYDISARRDASREISITIDHGYIDPSTFGAIATGADAIYTFDIRASFSDHSLKFSGCTIESYEFEIPQDGWITESITLRAKTVVRGW